MKSDTERKHYHKEKKHRRKKRLHVHLSGDLRSKLKVKKRSLLVRKEDSVRVMRGPGKGKGGPGKGGPRGGMQHRRPGPGLHKKILEKFDVDKDGKLSEEERKAAREAFRARRGEGKGEEGPGPRGRGPARGRRPMHRRRPGGRRAGGR